LLAIGVILFAPLGIFLTGSRAQAGLVVDLLLGIYIWSLWHFRRPALIWIGVLVILAGGFVVKEFSAEIYQIDQLSERYSDLTDSQAEGNDTRFITWKAGFDLMTSPPGFETIFGSGLGRTMGMVDDGMLSTSHYESSLFQAFSEGGFLGVLVRYLPAFMAIFVLIRKMRKDSHLVTLLLLWMVLYCFSVLTSPTASAYHIQIAYFSAVALAFELERVERALMKIKSLKKFSLARIRS
jgi:hypothetical protein